MQKKQSLLGTSNGSFSVVRVHCIDADFGDHKLISHYSPNFAEALQNIFEENQSITKYQSNRPGLADFLSVRILQFIYIPNMFSRQINAFALTKCTLTLHAIALYDLVLQIANLHFHTINVCSAELVRTEDIRRRNSYLPTSKYVPACRYYDHSPHNAAKRYSRFT